MLILNGFIVCFVLANTLDIGLGAVVNDEFLLSFIQEFRISRTLIATSDVKRDWLPLLSLRKNHRSIPMGIFHEEQNSSAVVIGGKDLIVIDQNPFSADFVNSVISNCEKKSEGCGYFLLNSDNQDLSSLQLVLNELNLDINAQFYIKDTQGDEIRLYEAYKLNNNSNATILNFGTWNKTGGMYLKEEGIWHRRRNLQHLHFEVVTELSSPYMTKMDYNESTGSYNIEGMFADIFHELQDIMNFTYTLRPSIDGEWGSLLEDGAWTGMVGMLHRKEVDIAVTDFTVTFERSQAITFSEPIVQIYHSLFIRNPQEVPNFRAYIEPLSLRVWLVIAVSVIVAAPLLYFVLWNGNEDMNRREFTIEHCLAYAASVLTFSRPWHTVPSSLRGKIFYGSLLFCGTLVFFHWEAMLISYLATRFTVLPFKSLSDYKISVSPGTSNMDVFKFYDDPVWQKAWKTRMEPFLDDFPKETTEQDQYIIDNPYTALYENFFAVRTYDSYLSCKIIAIPQRLDIKPYAIGLQKSSPYIGIFNHYIHQMRENGGLKRIIDKHEVEPQICPDYSGQALGFNSCFTAFLVFLAGLFITLALLTLECIAKKTSFFGFIEKFNKESTWKANSKEDLEALVSLLQSKIYQLERQLYRKS